MKFPDVRLLAGSFVRSVPIGLLLLLPAVLLLLAFFLLPLALAVWTSFLTYDPVRTAILPLTLNNYASLLGSAFYLDVIVRTFRLAAIVTLLLLIVGYPVALCLARVGMRARSILVVVLIGPLFVSVVARSYAWTVILGPSGLVSRALIASGLVSVPPRIMYTELAVIIGLAYVYLPYMVLSIDAALRLVDPELALAARTLGASPVAAFLRVTLPLSLPGVVSGMAIVFALTSTAYITPALLGGGSTPVLASVIYDNTLVTFNRPLASTVAAIFVFINVIIFGALVGLTRGREARLVPA